MLVEVDEDQNGTIEVEEFKKLLDKMLDDSDDLIIEAFKVFDKDGDGKVLPHEFREVMNNLGEALTDEELEKIYNDADDDGDGFVTITEFMMVYETVVH